MSQWSIPFEEIAKRTNSRVVDVVHAVAFEAFSRVIMRTPVDTGRLRGNWFPSFGAFVGYSPDPPDPGGENTIRRMRSSVLSYPVGGIIYLTNSLPYATVVEYGKYPDPPKHPTGKTSGGYSIQAPAGMVRVTAQEILTELQSKFDFGVPS